MSWLKKTLSDSLLDTCIGPSAAMVARAKKTEPNCLTTYTIINKDFLVPQSNPYTYVLGLAGKPLFNQPLNKNLLFVIFFECGFTRIILTI